MEKTCTKCKQTKDLSLFTTQPLGKLGRHAQCKKCMAEYTKKYTALNREARKEYNRIYKLANKETLSVYNQTYLKEYYKRNREKLVKQTSAYTTKRTREDVNFRLARNLRRRMHHVLKGNRKQNTTLELLGCSLEFLRDYLQNQFTIGMTWENYGPVWHVDHIKPLCSYDLTNLEQLQKAAHYNNLQPLFVLDNLKKGKKAQEPEAKDKKLLR